MVGFETGADDYVTKPFSPASWPCVSGRCCAAPGRRPARTTGAGRHQGRQPRRQPGRPRGAASACWSSRNRRRGRGVPWRWRRAHRHPTPYGQRVAKQLAEGLARTGVTVVSGLARGIDGIAHRAALDSAAGERWRCWPAGSATSTHNTRPGRRGGRPRCPDHREHDDGGAAQGAVPGAQPNHQRRVAWWWWSGGGEIRKALITAEHAADQGRTVLAVPGTVGDDGSAVTS